MRAFFGALILSIVSAIVGILAASELHDLESAAGSTQPSQKIQQWVNY